MFANSKKNLRDLINNHRGGLKEDNNLKGLVIPKGTVLYKLTKYPYNKEDNLKNARNPSPWWSFRDPNYIDEEGVVGRFIQSVMNGIKFTGMARYMSAVPVEWNTLDYYDEVRLIRDVDAAVGLFSVQLWYQNGKNTDRTNSLVKEIQDTGTVALPAHLGALPAWQLYINGITNDDIESVTNLQLEQGKEKDMTLCRHLLDVLDNSDDYDEKNNDRRMLNQYLNDEDIGKVGDMHIVK